MSKLTRQDEVKRVIDPHTGGLIKPKLLQHKKRVNNFIAAITGDRPTNVPQPEKKEPKREDSSKFIDRVINILVEMKLGEAKYEKNMGTREKMEIRDKRFAASNPHPKDEPHENVFSRREREHVNKHGTWAPGHVRNRVAARAKAEEEEKAKAQTGREDSSTQLIKNKIVEMFAGRRRNRVIRRGNASGLSRKSYSGGMKIGTNPKKVNLAQEGTPEHRMEQQRMNRIGGR